MEEMESVHQSSSDYIIQNLLIKKLQFSNSSLTNSVALSKYGSSVVKELNDKTQCEVVIYILEGKVQLEDKYNIEVSNKDLEGALKGKATYVINYINNILLRNITLATTICFGIIFLFSYLLSNEITIGNKGSTIPEDKLERIFEAFYTLDKH